LATPHVVLQLRRLLFSGGFLRERRGQHELGLEHRAGGIDQTGISFSGFPSQPVKFRNVFKKQPSRADWGGTKTLKSGYLTARTQFLAAEILKRLGSYNEFTISIKYLKEMFQFQLQRIDPILTLR
jgi:hypothetical protein